VGICHRPDEERFQVGPLGPRQQAVERFARRSAEADGIRKPDLEQDGDARQRECLLELLRADIGFSARPSEISFEVQRERIRDVFPAPLSPMPATFACIPPSFLSPGSNHLEALAGQSGTQSSKQVPKYLT
jgi:hypothetical protein